MTGKFFAEQGEHAAEWGQRFYGEGNFTVVTTDIPSDFAETLMRWDRLDGIGPARYVDETQLQEFNQLMNGVREWP